MSLTKVIESKPGDKGVISFQDYYGNKHLVQLVKDWTKLIRDRKQLDAMGGRAISGIIFTGPPGTGKTYLAQALATDSGSAFIGMGGADFTSMFFGVGVLKVRGMFSKARRYAKEYGSCILFIDEIDAIAMSRGGLTGQVGAQGAGGLMGGMGAMGILSRLLIEMDGITEVPLMDKIQNRIRKFFLMQIIDPGVVLPMGSTNRPDVLDPAILRPGRFDRRIDVGLPDRESRRAIFEGYLSKVKHTDDVNVDDLVKVTPGVSPAFIMSAITKDAVRLAIIDGRGAIRQHDILLALQELAAGLPQPIGELEPRQKEVLAIHEAGHAVTAYNLLQEHASVAWASIVRRGGSLGRVVPLEKEDRYVLPLERMKKWIIVSLAGHAAVEVITGEAWTGASGDLNNVRAMVAQLIGYLDFGVLPTDSDPFKNIKRKELDAAFKKYLDETRAYISEHRTEVEAMTQALLEREEMDSNEIREVMESVK